jgi:hypothetical protein
MVQNSDAIPRTVGTRRSPRSFHHGLASDHYNALTPHTALTPRWRPRMVPPRNLPSLGDSRLVSTPDGGPSWRPGLQRLSRAWGQRLLYQLTLLHQLHGHWRYVCQHMRTMGKRQVRGS